MSTYSCRLIINHLKSKGIVYKRCNARILWPTHGIRINLDNDMSLSVQTHPDIAAIAFAETCLQKECKGALGLVEDDDLGYRCFGACSLGYYEDVQRFDEPQELFDHLDKVLQKYKQTRVCSKVNDSSVDRQHGKRIRCQTL
jgi:hypothetical protein